MNAGVNSIGIVACKMFEDELVEVLSRDKKLLSIYVIRNEEVNGFVKKMMDKCPSIDMKVITTDDIELLDLDSSSAVVWLKPMALHHKPERLREDLIETLFVLKKKCKVVLLFYGLCGNALKRIDEMKMKTGCEVEIIRDVNGEIVDDCIGAVIGGSDEYLKCLRTNKGSFFLTPMWASNWREMLHKVQIMRTPEDIEGARFVFESVGYNKVVKLDTGLGHEDEFERNVQDFAKTFGFQREELKGDLSIIFRSYVRARSLVLSENQRNQLDGNMSQ
jgi:hypothetical protein